MAETQSFTGRIYMITAPGHEGCYVGSTTKTLEQRLLRHKNSYTSYLNGKQGYTYSFEIVKHEGSVMHLLHEGEFYSKRDMEKMEGHFIDNTPGAVNKKGAGMTQQEIRHKHYVKNREQYIEKIQCDVCGGRYTSRNKSNHYKTKKHQAALESQSDDGCYSTASLLLQPSV